MESGGNMLEKRLESFPQAQESESAQGLHEALCRSLPEIVSEAYIFQIRSAVFFRFKDRHGSDAALGNMVGIFRNDDPGYSNHPKEIR
jgi:hypothetical protein